MCTIVKEYHLDFEADYSGNKQIMLKWALLLNCSATF